MKTSLLISLLFYYTTAVAQTNDTTLHVKDSTQLATDSILIKTDSNAAMQLDTTPVRNPALYNKYGDLLNDDPAYNPRYPVWIPALRVLLTDVANWSLDRYVYNFDWAHISASTWKHNLKTGWEWDTDKFGINFIGHPHTGNYYFNVARSNGYSYWGSIPFAIEGSLIWEYFGENTLPSKNDIINTPISGAFLGEIFYRLSSNILDDRTTGSERVLRELFAGILNPPRFLNRLTQGKMFRVTSKQVYQEEPLNFTLYSGVHRVNRIEGAGSKFGTGATNAFLNMQMDYGDPFETRHRKPFDLFRFRVELSYGANNKLLDNVNGYGILTGRNIKENRLLGGLFQHFDYWNTSTFEIGSIGFGGGLISKIPIAHHSNLYSGIHLAVVPLAGNNSQYGPDTSEFRHYNFGGGMEGKVEEMFNIHNWATIGFAGYFYWIHTYDGFPGNSLIGIFKPTVTVRLINNLSLGFEHHIYHNDRYLKNIANLHLTRTEQKVFLQLFFQDRKRQGKYH